MAEDSEDFDQATKQYLIDQARKQVDGLSRWSGGSLRLEAYRVIDTMNELVLLAEREHSGSSEEADRGLATGGVVSSDQALLVGEGGCLLPPSSARVTGSSGGEQ